MERVGGGDLQRRIAREERGERAGAGGMRQSSRAAPGEAVELAKPRGGDVAAQEPGARAAVNQGEEFSGSPIADVDRLGDAFEPSESASRLRIDE